MTPEQRVRNNFNFIFLGIGCWFLYSRFESFRSGVNGFCGIDHSNVSASFDYCATNEINSSLVWLIKQPIVHGISYYTVYWSTTGDLLRYSPLLFLSLWTGGGLLRGESLARSGLAGRMCHGDYSKDSCSPRYG